MPCKTPGRFYQVWVGGDVTTYQVRLPMQRLLTWSVITRGFWPWQFALRGPNIHHFEKFKHLWWLGTPEQYKFSMAQEKSLERILSYQLSEVKRARRRFFKKKLMGLFTTC